MLIIVIVRTVFIASFQPLYIPAQSTNVCCAIDQLLSNRPIAVQIIGPLDLSINHTACSVDSAVLSVDRAD